MRVRDVAPQAHEGVWTTTSDLLPPTINSESHRYSKATYLPHYGTPGIGPLSKTVGRDLAETAQMISLHLRVYSMAVEEQDPLA